MASARATTRLASSTWRFSINLPSTTSTPRPAATACACTAMIERAPGDILRRRGENRIGRGYGLRMDERLAVKTEFHRLVTRGGKPGVILQIEMDAIERGQPIGPCRKHTQPQTGEQGQTLAGMTRVQVFHEIRGPHHQDR